MPNDPAELLREAYRALDDPKFDSALAALLSERDELAERVKELERHEFPIIPVKDAAPHPMRIPWSVAEKAYSSYAAKYGSNQSLKRIAERGGFYANEMDEYHPAWRDECSELSAALARAEAAEHQRDEARKALLKIASALNVEVGKTAYPEVIATDCELVAVALRRAIPLTDNETIVESGDDGSLLVQTPTGARRRIWGGAKLVAELEFENAALRAKLEAAGETLRAIQWRTIAGYKESAYPTCVGCGAKRYGALGVEAHADDCPIEAALARFQSQSQEQEQT